MRKNYGANKRELSTFARKVRCLSELSVELCRCVFWKSRHSDRSGCWLRFSLVEWRRGEDNGINHDTQVKSSPIQHPNRPWPLEWISRNRLGLHEQQVNPFIGHCFGRWEQNIRAAMASKVIHMHIEGKNKRKENQRKLAVCRLWGQQPRTE